MPGVFPKDTVVYIYDVNQAAGGTPTKVYLTLDRVALSLDGLISSVEQRPGQTNAWQKSMVDTSYRVQKLVQQEVTVLRKTEDQGGAIVHKHLATTPGGEPSETVYSYNDIVRTRSSCGKVLC